MRSAALQAVADALGLLAIVLMTLAILSMTAAHRIDKHRASEEHRDVGR